MLGRYLVGAWSVLGRFVTSHLNISVTLSAHILYSGSGNPALRHSDIISPMPRPQLSRTFRLYRTDAFVEKVAALQRKGDGKRLGKWLTGEEVCGQLRISLRTLQKLRDRGFIGYSQIGFRFYYKPEDVKRLIPLIGTICPTDK